MAKKRQGSGKVTIKDIAEIAGVSYATVSRALNHAKDINKTTKKNILTIARNMGYKPNGIARSLVKNRSQTIALMVPDISYSFFSEIALAAEDAANNYGYNMFLCNTRWDNQIEAKLLDAVEEKCVDGIILHLASDDVSNIQNRSTPIVLIGCHYGQNHSYIEVDNLMGGLEATECLIQSGYKRIANISGLPSFLPNVDRTAGYKKALEKHGLPIHKKLIRFGENSIEAGYNECARFLQMI